MDKSIATNTDSNSIIEKYDWYSLTTAAQPRGFELPNKILALARSQTDSEADKWYWQLENTVVVQGSVYDSALATIDLILHYWKNFSLSEVAKLYLLELIYQIIHGEPDSSAIKNGNQKLVSNCIYLVSQNINLLKDIDDVRSKALFEDIQIKCNDS